MSAPPTPLHNLAKKLTAHAARILPHERALWAKAMAEEIAYIENGGLALRWAVGYVSASYRERIKTMSFVQRTNRVGAIAPVVMSLIALSLVLFTVLTGWERDLKDEGVGAHLFQLLILGQVPFVVAYLVTANWRSVLGVAKPIALQLTVLAIAVAPVAFFHL